MSLFDKFFAPDPHAPQQKPAVIVPTTPREDFAAVRAATSGPSNLIPRQATIKPGSVILPETLLVKPVEEAEVTIVKQPESLPSFQPQVPAVIKTEEAPAKFVPSQQAGEAEVEIVQVAEPVIISEEKLARFSGRQFVDQFLAEVGLLIEEGKKLQAAHESKDVQAEQTGKNKETIASLKDGSDRLLLSIELALKNAGADDFGTRLQTVYSSYSNFLQILATEANNIDENTRKNSNILLTEIQKRKQEVGKLLKALGGQEVFDKIKLAIRSMEKVGRTFVSRNFPEGELSKVVVGILDNKNEYVGDDPEGAKLLVQSGNIVDVLVAVINHKKN